MGKNKPTIVIRLMVHVPAQVLEKIFKYNRWILAKTQPKQRKPKNATISSHAITKVKASKETKKRI